MSVAVAVNDVLLPTLVGVVDDELPSDGPAVNEGAVLNIQPVLLETLVELDPGFQVAPPVAAESLKER